jgi:hypothetical protein
MARRLQNQDTKRFAAKKLGPFPCVLRLVTYLILKIVVHSDVTIEATRSSTSGV